MHYFHIKTVKIFWGGGIAPHPLFEHSGSATAAVRYSSHIPRRTKKLAETSS